VAVMVAAALAIVVGMVGVLGVAMEAKQKKRKAGDVEGSKSKGKAKSITDLLLISAAKTKSKYLTVTGQCAALLHQVRTDPAFGWISQQILDPVLQSQSKLQGQLTTFTLELVSGVSTQELKKKYSDLEVKLREAIGIEAYLKGLQKEMDIIMKMNAARTPHNS
jgi:hypothetical protein